jgi:hypothetical protein
MSGTPDREPVGQAVNYILSALDIIAAMALKPADYDEVAAEEKKLAQIKSRVDLILSFIDARRPQKPGLRIVK